ncbi:poor homologous synapsis 1 [Prunus dulcis]|uniref:Poor homologous synapsis 1 n=1 Tax=Prunus dulcis TaxID=3755 RepID=A0A4Y1QQA5_PRUDU|nr:poor homologous synapsis 1 [Prunus dulcis]
MALSDARERWRSISLASSATLLSAPRVPISSLCLPRSEIDAQLATGSPPPSQLFSSLFTTTPSPKSSSLCVQKFALRFLSVDEAQRFMNSLKEIFNTGRDIEPLNIDLGSEISAESEFMSSNIPLSRVSTDLNIMPPSQTCTTQISPSLNNQAKPYSRTQEVKNIHNFQRNFPAFPPGFTSLPSDCHPAVEQAKSTVSEAVNLNSQILPPSFTSWLSNSHPVVEQVAAQSTVSQEVVSQEVNLISQLARYGRDASFQGGALCFQATFYLASGFMHIQKFGFRFLSLHEAEKFMNALKGICKEGMDTEPVNTDVGSQISSESELTACKDLTTMTPVQTYTPKISPSLLNNEAEQYSCTQEFTPIDNFQSNFAALPPSFTSFLSNCGPVVEQVVTQPTGSQEVDLKSQIARYMEDASFQDMLFQVEKVISEIGGDSML